MILHQCSAVEGFAINRSNERDFLKCLQEITHAIERVSYLLAEERRNKKEVIEILDDFVQTRIEEIIPHRSHSEDWDLDSISELIGSVIPVDTAKLKDDIYDFVKKFDIDLLIPQNALTIPLNIPLGIAITEFIAETNFRTLAHHHDFYWERDRFITNAVPDYLNTAFPPNLHSIRHTVINSFADEQLSLRTGISAFICPNVMDFENPPPPADDYASDVREALGVEEDELFILQPTRVVRRKGIEHAIELVHRLGMKAKLVISHASGDEGDGYEKRLKEYSKLMKVDTVFVPDIIDEKRGLTDDGRKVYTLGDIYPHADLVTYPSIFEGFGNAFLEAVYYHRPIVVNTYSIYTKDIKPKGFSAIEIDGYVTQASIERTREVLEDAELRKRMVDQNYEVAKRFFSYDFLRRRLRSYIIQNPWFFD